MSGADGDAGNVGPDRLRKKKARVEAEPPRRSRERQVTAILDAIQPRRHRDIRWMRRAQRQLERIRPERGTLHAENVRGMKLYFPRIGVASSDRVQREYGVDAPSSGDDDSSLEGGEIDKVQCYILSDEAARKLINSHEEICAPIFVASPEFLPFEDERDSRRPIVKLFDWFTDPGGEFEWVDSSEKDKKETLIELSAVKQRFLENSGPERVVMYPCNLPDMAHPFQTNGAPKFVQTPNSNLLVDIMRWHLDVTVGQICFSSCEEPRVYAHSACEEHFITDKALASLQADWRAWQGTVMLAESGAITLPHDDRWGYGTWIRCLEGEMGLAWQSHPTEEERAATREHEPAGTWLLKVLRNGDAVYMSPGTLHLVFRRSDRGQTLALAGHVLRRCDVERWFILLGEEVDRYLTDEEDNVSRGDTVRCLVEGARRSLEMAGRSKDKSVDKYGGANVVKRVDALMMELERKAKELDDKYELMIRAKREE